MSIENPQQELQLNDFMRELSAIMTKWQAEGNVDSEFDVASTIRRQVEDGDITPTEGIDRLRGIDDSRIER
ncbi:MAG TPA: hypothetical protein VKP88_02135 [Candidatus Paceibacterota bacterium]|nr:hypothetical protein [Candidatus Paceibacterota bacterium]